MRGCCRANRATVLFGAGDVVAQFIEQIRQSGFAWDIMRSLRSAFVGAVTSGWMTPLHMRFMDFLFTRGPLAGVPGALAPWGKRASSVVLPGSS